VDDNISKGLDKPSYSELINEDVLDTFDYSDTEEEDEWSESYFLLFSSGRFMSNSLCSDEPIQDASGWSSSRFLGVP
jgi:hypothetical protein